MALCSLPRESERNSGHNTRYVYRIYDVYIEYGTQDTYRYKQIEQCGYDVFGRLFFIQTLRRQRVEHGDPRTFEIMPHFWIGMIWEFFEQSLIIIDRVLMHMITRYREHTTERGEGGLHTWEQ